MVFKVSSTQTMLRFYDSTISQHPDGASEHLLGPKRAAHVWPWKGNLSHTRGKYSVHLAVYLRYLEGLFAVVVSWSLAQAPHNSERLHPGH